METYDVTQKILAWGPTYEVRANHQPEVIMTIKGKLLTASPKLTMVEGVEGPEVASMQGNFIKTKFECFDANKQLIGALVFPLLTFKKGFTLTVGGAEYKADGGFFGGEFKCTDAAGQVVMVIAKQLALRDKFAVQTTGVLPRDVALLAAVAIDQRFFQED